MGANWFEGGRRISSLLMWLVVGASAVSLFSGGTTPVRFETGGPTDNFHLTMERCDYPDQTRHIRGDDFLSNVPDISLCFRSSGDKLAYATGPLLKVPSQVPGSKETFPVGTYRLGNPFSPEVEQYLDSREAQFRAAGTWYDIARDNLWKSRLYAFWHRLSDTLPWTGGAIFFIWIATALVGWIVRGFACIPSGKDYRNL